MIILLATLFFVIPLWIMSDLLYVGKAVLSVLPLVGRATARVLIPGQLDTEWIACITEADEAFCEDPAYYLIGDDWYEYVVVDRPQPSLVEMRWLYYAVVFARAGCWFALFVCARIAYWIYTLPSKEKRH